MNPFARISSSLALTLVVWGPNAIAQWQSGPDALRHAALRFLVIFTFSRVALRAVDGLVRTYLRASGRDPVPVDATVVGESRESLSLGP